MPVSVLKNHTGSVNGIAWAPHSTCHLVTAGPIPHPHIYANQFFLATGLQPIMQSNFGTLAEDCQALIWDVHQIPRAVEDPILAYAAGGEVINGSKK